MFERHYPKEVTNRALKVFKQKVSDGADPLAINRGVRIYKTQIKNIDPKYIKSPENWLLEEKWKDPTLNASLRERMDKK